MQGPKNPNANLSNYGINNANEFWNLTSSELEKITLEQGLGQMTSTGAISVDTGEFRGRSPKDRFIVKDDVTKDVNCRPTYTELKAIETGCIERCSNLEISLKSRVTAFALYILT